MKRFALVLIAAALGLAQPALADTPQSMLKRFESEAAPGDVARGARFFSSRAGGEWSCSTCHTDSPTRSGRHAKTDKPIAPLAPAANAERFTDSAKTEKWFKRNCNDVLGRLCSAQEKADVLAWLISQK